ncbi:hypothetical protein M947_07855 [Sulfurimonas hongkongensis]|uniref:Uncharacterized protein n=1 Tax=Sulfurimonas hongkongensis TaxID=1172190 RepID=T0JLQ5_9BACT|nr:hypothetical protein M947_07855 [Sulfurimonas hongkongensis]
MTSLAVIPCLTRNLIGFSRDPESKQENRFLLCKNVSLELRMTVEEFKMMVFTYIF